MHITNDWIRGFVDGDGCFNIEKRVTKGEISMVRHRFMVSQDRRSKDVLYALKEAFKCGNVHEAGSNMFIFQISKKESIKNIVIPFFRKYPLQTEKRKSFYLFAESALGCEDFGREQEKVFSFSINQGWLAGFIDAEGCFSVSTVKNYPRPQLLIGVSQVERALLVELQTYLQCGRIRLRKDGFLIYQVSSSRDLQDHVFPKLFTRAGNPLLRTIKRVSSQKFKKIVTLFLEKQHRVSTIVETPPDMEKITKLKANLDFVPPVC